MTVDHYFPTFSVALSGFDRPACFVESTLVVLDAPVGFVVSRLPALDNPAGFGVFAGAFVTLSGLVLRLRLAVEPPSVSTTFCTYSSAVLLVMHAFTVDIEVWYAHQRLMTSPLHPRHQIQSNSPTCHDASFHSRTLQLQFHTLHTHDKDKENIHRMQKYTMLNCLDRVTKNIAVFQNMSVRCLHKRGDVSADVRALPKSFCRCHPQRGYALITVPAYLPSALYLLRLDHCVGVVTAASIRKNCRNHV